MRLELEKAVENAVGQSDGKTPDRSLFDWESVSIRSEMSQGEIRYGNLVADPKPFFRLPSCFYEIHNGILAAAEYLDKKTATPKSGGDS